MLSKTVGALALVSAIAVPGIAQAAASAIATADVNLRAGPSTRYPVVDVVLDGDDVRVYGCLSDWSWCDVSYRGYRGWMSANYLAYFDDGRRYVGSSYIGRIGTPVISFSFGTYWDDHYRGRAFYRDRDRYDDWREVRRERREDRREVRRERREDRRDIRQERREVKQERRDVRNARDELREARRAGENVREERRQVRQERRQLRQERRDLRQERRDR